MALKVGDKVRFLNAQGGGVVSKIVDRDTVLVTDESGFDFPTKVRECVAVDAETEGSLRFDHPTKKKTILPEAKKGNDGHKKELEKTPQKERFDEEHITDVLYAQPERPDGDVLNAYLAFVPVDKKVLSATSFEWYLINDSNYELAYVVSSGKTMLERRAAGFILPNTKEFIEELTPDQLSSIENISVQLIAFKKNKAYMRKNVVDNNIHLNPIRFCKLHNFTENDFFDEDALILPVVEDDSASSPMQIDANNIAKAMREKEVKDNKPTSKSSKPNDDIIVIDLHINELLDNTNGMSNYDMLQYQMSKFREEMDANLLRKGQKIVFIHGKGDGVLRQNILKELKHSYKTCTWQDASFQEYGFGATQVTIR